MEFRIPDCLPSRPKPPPGLARKQHRDLPVVSDYVLIRRIGSGGYGEVWLARNTFGEYRALKIVWREDFDDDDRPFQREFEGIRRFEPISRSHPSQLSILHVGRNETAGCFYYVMELADPAPTTTEAELKPDAAIVLSETGYFTNPPGISGVALEKYIPHTLRYEIKTKGRLPLPVVLDLGITLAEGLSHLHAQGLVHRDIKPSNVIFIQGSPKLADIGLVTEQGNARSVVGTIGYIAPEGSGTVQADLYSLGKLLYEVAMGRDRREFPKLAEDWQTIPDRPRLTQLNEVLLRACAPDVHSRYRSAAEMSSDLACIRAGKSLTGWKTWPANLRKREGEVWILSIVAVLFLAWFLRSDSSGSTPQWSGNEKANAVFKSGLFYFQQDSALSFTKAAECFEKAATLDPTFARSWARLALTYVWIDASNPDGLARAREFAQKALALAPRLDEAHHAMGAIKSLLEHDWIDAEKEHLAAIKLNPNSEDNYYGYGAYLSLMGRTNEALQQVDRALRLDSHSLVDQQEAAFILVAARQYDRAIAVCTNVIAHEAGSRERLTRNFLIPAFRGKGDYRTAILLEKEAALLRKENEEKTNSKCDALMDAFVHRGQNGYWEETLRWKVAEGATPFDLAVVHARLGHKELALGCLDRALLESPTKLAFYINREPAFDLIRREQGFVGVLRRLGMVKS